MLLEMSADLTHNIDTYSTTFTKMKADCKNGLTVAFVSEGDISFYSTFVHLLRLIRAEGLPVEIIAGVSSFLAACAVHVEPLAVLKDRIAIIPLLDNSNELEYHLLNFNTVVLIKVRRAAELVTPFVQAGQPGFAVYVRNSIPPPITKPPPPPSLPPRLSPFSSLILHSPFISPLSARFSHCPLP